MTQCNFIFKRFWTKILNRCVKFLCAWDSADARFELWRFDSSQKLNSVTENSVWKNFGGNSCIHCVKLSSLFDSRDARLEVWKFDFSQKAASLSKAWHTANSVWTTFGANSWMNFVKFSFAFDSRDAKIWSSEGLISVPSFVVYPRTLFARNFFQQNLMRTLK